jgi:hypothetical protein
MKVKGAEVEPGTAHQTLDHRATSASYEFVRRSLAPLIAIASPTRGVAFFEMSTLEEDAPLPLSAKQIASLGRFGPGLGQQPADNRYADERT